MKGKRHVQMAIVLLIALAATTLRPPGLSADRRRPTAVSVEHIGTKVTLVGRLGQPLGQMMEVKGTWGAPAGIVKDPSLRFRVTHVNGKKLHKPVEFNVRQIKAMTRGGKDAIPAYEEQKELEGVYWTLRAYETGRFRAVPEDYWLLAGAWLHRQGARALFGDWARPSFVEDPELTALKELLRVPDQDQDPRR